MKKVFAGMCCAAVVSLMMVSCSIMDEGQDMTKPPVATGDAAIDTIAQKAYDIYMRSRAINNEVCGLFATGPDQKAEPGSLSDVWNIIQSGGKPEALKESKEVLIGVTKKLLVAKANLEQLIKDAKTALPDAQNALKQQGFGPASLGAKGKALRGVLKHLTLTVNEAGKLLLNTATFLQVAAGVTGETMQ